MAIADRIVAKHYRSPQASQGFVDLGPELRAGIVEEILPLLDHYKPAGALGVYTGSTGE